MVAQRAEAVRRKQGADVQIRWFSAVFEVVICYNRNTYIEMRGYHGVFYIYLPGAVGRSHHHPVAAERKRKESIKISSLSMQLEADAPDGIDDLRAPGIRYGDDC